MNVTAGGLIHIRIGTFPLGVWYCTATRRGTPAMGFDTPQSVLKSLARDGVPAPDEVHLDIMAVTSATDGNSAKNRPGLADWYCAVRDKIADGK